MLEERIPVIDRNGKLATVLVRKSESHEPHLLRQGPTERMAEYFAGGRRLNVTHDGKFSDPVTGVEYRRT